MMQQVGNKIQGAQWYAVKTRYKCEKYVAAALRRKGVEVYVPLLKRTKRYTRKIKHYEIPLISCYIFVYMDLSQRIRVLETVHVVEFVGFDGYICPIPQTEIDTMRQVVGEIQEVDAQPLGAFSNGAEVEVIMGQLTGLRGRLVTMHGKDDFIVELNSLGYELRMTIDRRLLRKTGSPLGVSGRA